MPHLEQINSFESEKAMKPALEVWRRREETPHLGASTLESGETSCYLRRDGSHANNIICSLEELAVSCSKD